MPAKLSLSGPFVFRFAGFDRDTNRARHVTGVGQVVLNPTSDNSGTIVAGSQSAQRVTNSPMSGQLKDLLYSEYQLTGTYDVIEPGPPILATAKVTFNQSLGGLKRMTDVFALVQSGPDRLWLMGTDPRLELDEHGNADPKQVQELVVGELVRVDMSSW
jgi:hypothetical protein